MDISECAAFVATFSRSVSISGSGSGSGSAYTAASIEGEHKRVVVPPRLRLRLQLRLRLRPSHHRFCARAPPHAASSHLHARGASSSSSSPSPPPRAYPTRLLIHSRALGASGSASSISDGAERTTHTNARNPDLLARPPRRAPRPSTPTRSASPAPRPTQGIRLRRGATPHLGGRVTFIVHLCSRYWKRGAGTLYLEACAGARLCVDAGMRRARVATGSSAHVSGAAGAAASALVVAAPAHSARRTRAALDAAYGELAPRWHRAVAPALTTCL
ncbi:hypothetical protein B0H15DRAFT_577797 [Mycena belliarum]|uniref:Uncharacterized protein n=1 Tax=Mycena belliarum TaxID=1033014 RepID=A0AAD6TSI4_9AGAR|nr:hypothetical protein B0H15DRAFT_577797 [Mycena belliae]